jgi:hypothetical protein
MDKIIISNPGQAQLCATRYKELQNEIKDLKQALYDWCETEGGIEVDDKILDHQPSKSKTIKPFEFVDVMRDYDIPEDVYLRCLSVKLDQVDFLLKNLPDENVGDKDIITEDIKKKATVVKETYRFAWKKKKE